MLPAYEESYYYSIYFVIYLVFGLYFLLNILLANVFSMYKKRLELKQEKRSEVRKNRLRAYFDKYDIGDKGYLHVKEAKKFFGHVLDLKYNKVKHQKTFQKIMKQVAEIDSENNHIVMKEKVVEYFSTPGFLDLERLE